MLSTILMEIMQWCWWCYQTPSEE